MAVDRKKIGENILAKANAQATQKATVSTKPTSDFSTAIQTFSDDISNGRLTAQQIETRQTELSQQATELAKWANENRSNLGADYDTVGSVLGGWNDFSKSLKGSLNDYKTAVDNTPLPNYGWNRESPELYTAMQTSGGSAGEVLALRDAAERLAKGFSAEELKDIKVGRTDLQYEQQKARDYDTLRVIQSSIQRGDVLMDEQQKQWNDLNAKYKLSADPNANDFTALAAEQKRFMEQNESFAGTWEQSALNDPDREKYIALGSEKRTGNIGDLNERGQWGWFETLGIGYQGENLTDEQEQTYNYYLGKYGREAADQYYQSIAESVNYQYGEKLYQQAQESGKLAELALIAASSYAGAIEDARLGLGVLTGLTKYNEYQAPAASPMQIADQLTLTDYSDNGQNKVRKFIGDITQNTANMLPSIQMSALLGTVSPSLGKYAGQASMGLEVFGRAYRESRGQGYSDMQSKIYAGLNTASELALGDLLGGIEGIENGTLWNKLRSTGKPVFTKIANFFDDTLAGKVLSEAQEEFWQDIIDPVIRKVTFNEDININLPEALYSGLMGGVTAFLLDSPSTAAMYVQDKKLNGRTVRQAGTEIQQAGTVNDLVKLGQTFSADTQAYKLVGRLNENSKPTQIGKALQAVSAQLTEQNQQDMSRYIQEKYGLPEKSANTLVEFFAAYTSGIPFTVEGEQILDANAVITDAFLNTIIDPNVSENERNHALMELAQNAYFNEAMRNPETAFNRRNQAFNDFLRDTAAKTAESTEAEKTAEAPAPVAEAPAAVDETVDETVDESVKAVENPVPETVNEAEAPNRNDRDVRTVLTESGVVSPHAVDVLSDSYMATGGGMDTTEFVADAERAYNMGRYGLNMEVETKNDPLKISAQSAQTAYSLGKLFAGQEVGRSVQSVGEALKGKAGVSLGEVTYEYDNKNVKLTEREKASVDVMTSLAKGLGLKVGFYESEMHNGVRSYKDASGRYVPAPNGLYRSKDGTIHIDVHAGQSGRGVVMFTAAHELTHFIKDWSPAKYKELANFLVEQYGKAGRSVDSYVHAQQEKAKRSGRSIGYAQAFDEFVADSMETMLQDGNVAEKLRELEEQHNDIWTKIKEFFTDFAAKVQKMVKEYEGMKPDSAEGRFVQELDQSVREIMQRMYAEAVFDASENYRRANSTEAVSEAQVTAQAEPVVEEVVEAPAEEENAPKKEENAPAEETVEAEEMPEEAPAESKEPEETAETVETVETPKAEEKPKAVETPKAEAARGEDGKKADFKGLRFPGKNAGEWVVLSDRDQNYPFTQKSFAEQIDDWLADQKEPDVSKRKIRADDTLLLGGAPEVLRKIGMTALPITINQRHLRESLLGTGNADHVFNEEVIKKLPELIADPIAVIASETHEDTSLVVIIDAKSANNKDAIAAVYVDGYGQLNLKPVNSNAVTTVHGRKNTISLLNNAIQRTVNGETRLFYWDKNKAINLDRQGWLQLPTPLPSNGFVHSITEPGSPVKPKFSNQTETEQFKRWFGKSEVVNEDGTPRIVYHQTDRQFTVFNTNNPVAGEYDSETPNGIFFKQNDHDIGVGGDYVNTGRGGDIQMGVYLSAQKMLHFANRDAARQWYDLNVDGYKNLRLEMKKALAAINEKMEILEDSFFVDEAISEEEFDKQWEALKEEMETEENKYRKQLRELLNQYFLTGKSGYDGIELEHDGRRYIDGKRENVHTYIVFSPTQVKSATDNIGTFDANEPDIRYSDRDPSLPATRAELAQRLLDSAETDAEREKLTAYLDVSRKLDEQQAKLEDYNQKLKKERGKQQLSVYRDEAQKAINRIDTLDKQLARMEREQVVRETVNRYNSARDKTRQDNWRDESRRRREADKARVTKTYVQALERQGRLAEATILNQIAENEQNVARLVEERNRLLYESQKHETGMMVDYDKKLKAQDEKLDKARKKVDALNAELKTAREKAKDKLDATRIYDEAEKRKALREQKERYETKIDKLEMANRTRILKTALSGIEKKLVGEKGRSKIIEEMQPLARDTLEYTRRFMEGDQVVDGQKLMFKLASTYSQLWNGDSEYADAAFSEQMLWYIQHLGGRLENVTIYTITEKDLKLVTDVVRAIAHTIDTADSLFGAERQNTTKMLGQNTISEFMDQRQAKPKSAVLDVVSEQAGKALWANEKPIYAFRMLNSPTLTRLFNDVLYNGQSVFSADVFRGHDVVAKAQEDCGFNGWDFRRTYDFNDKFGKTIHLNLEQMMYLYALAKRGEQATNHIFNGGIVFGKLNNGKYVVADYSAHPLTPDTLSDIVDTLGDQYGGKAVRYVDTIQKYLSTTLANDGNQVSREMNGIEIFGEENYIPIVTENGGEAKEVTFEREHGFGKSMANPSFSKATTSGASNPILMMDFTKIAGTHIEDMATYHAYAIPVTNIKRVLSYKERGKAIPEGRGRRSVSAAISQRFGNTVANQYIHQLLDDLAGSARPDPTATLLDRSLSRFKKSAVFMSLSVGLQQYSSIVRSLYADLSPKYFVGARVTKANVSRTWEQLCQYSGTARFKEIGGVDIGTRGSTLDWITNPKKYGWSNFTGKIDKAGGAFPEIMDKLAWCDIWNAVLREMRAKYPKITGETFYKMAGRRFDEIINLTQVYDSTLTRSQAMRSKDKAVKSLTSFMAEGTVQNNMLIDGLVKGGGRFALASASIIMSAVFNNILKSLIVAGRDDDKKKSYVEKYLSSLFEGTLNDVMPWNYTIFLKDIASIVKGYSDARPELSMYDDTITNFTKLFKKLSNGDEITWKDLENSIGELLNFADLPVKNISRDIRSIFNAFSSAPISETNWYEIMSGAFPNLFPDGNKTKLYYAVTTGNEAYQKRIRGWYETEAKYHTAVQGALAENDPRIVRAAQEWYDQNLPAYRDTINEITGDGFLAEDVFKAVKSVYNKLFKEKAEASDPLEGSVSIFDAEMFVTSVVNGLGMEQEIIDELTRAKLVEIRAKDAEDPDAWHTEDFASAEERAQGSVRSTLVSTIVNQYADGTLSENDAVKALEWLGEDEHKLRQKDFEESTDAAWSDRTDYYFESARDNYGDLDEVRKLIIAGDGRTEEKVVESLQEAIVSRSKDAYTSGELTSAEAQNLMVRYGGKTVSEAKDIVTFLDFRKRNPNSDITEMGDLATYNEKYKPYGITVQQRDDFYRYYAGIEGRSPNTSWCIEYYTQYKKYGLSIKQYDDYKVKMSKQEGEGKKARCMVIIDALPISNKQKDEIYYSYGWAASTINEAPWH